MNLWNFISRWPYEKPSRFVTDYKMDEVARFQEEYRPLAAKYRRHQRIGIFGVAVFFLCIFLSMILPKTLFIYLWAAGMCSWIFTVFFASQLIPKCPGCHNSPAGGFGAFCPDCGHRALELNDSWFYWSPTCRSCGKRMRGGRGRSYKIRTCTHCGLLLDEKGF